jgi:hypothetical protein
LVRDAVPDRGAHGGCIGGGGSRKTIGESGHVKLRTLRESIVSVWVSELIERYSEDSREVGTFDL